MSIRTLANTIARDREYDWWLIPRFHLEPGRVVPRPGHLIFKEEGTEIIRVNSKTEYYVQIFYSNAYYYARIK